MKFRNLGPALGFCCASACLKEFEHVIPTVIRSGRPVPFTDWASVSPK
jgi:hypothetical protein